MSAAGRETTRSILRTAAVIVVGVVGVILGIGVYMVLFMGPPPYKPPPRDDLPYYYAMGGDGCDEECYSSWVLSLERVYTCSDNKTWINYDQKFGRKVIWAGDGNGYRTVAPDASYENVCPHPSMIVVHPDGNTSQ